MHPEDLERQRPAGRTEDMVDGGGARGGEGRHVERALSEADNDNPCPVEPRQVADVALGQHGAAELGLTVERGAVLALGVLADGDDEVVDMLDELAVPLPSPEGAGRGRPIHPRAPRGPRRPRAGAARRTPGPPPALRGSGRSGHSSGAGRARRARESC